MSAYLFIKHKRETAERIQRVLDLNLAMAEAKTINTQLDKWKEELL